MMLPHGAEILCACLCASAGGAENAAEWVARADFKAKEMPRLLCALRTASSLDPESAKLRRKSFLLAVTNRQSEAIPHFNKAVQLNPAFRGPHYICVAYWLSKDPTRSIPNLPWQCGSAPRTPITVSLRFRAQRRR